MCGGGQMAERKAAFENRECKPAAMPCGWDASVWAPRQHRRHELTKSSSPADHGPGAAGGLFEYAGSNASRGRRHCTQPRKAWQSPCHQNAEEGNHIAPGASPQLAALTARRKRLTDRAGHGGGSIGLVPARSRPRLFSFFRKDGTSPDGDRPRVQATTDQHPVPERRSASQHVSATERISIH